MATFDKSKKAGHMAMPQGSFKGPSRDDILNALSVFFGQAAAPEKLSDYTSQHAATYAFPDAYIGQSTTLRDTMINLILQSPQTWHTSSMLPFTSIEGTTVEWDEMRFDVRLMNRVPYEGVSRMQTSIKRRHRDRILRRGLAMMIESDFYATPAGQRYFQQQGKQRRDEWRNISVIRGKFKAGVMIAGKLRLAPLRGTLEEAARDATELREEQAKHRTTAILATNDERTKAHNKAAKVHFKNITPVDGKYRANVMIAGIRVWAPHRATVEDAVRDLGPLKDRQREELKMKMAETRKRAAIYIKFRNRFKACLRGLHPGDKLRSMEAVGCSWDYLHAHLRSRLRPGASLEDPGMSIDHIFPVSRYDFTKVEHQRMANHYTNLRPIPMLENNKKRAKLPSKQEGMLVDKSCWPPGIDISMLC